MARNSPLVTPAHETQLAQRDTIARIRQGLSLLILLEQWVRKEWRLLALGAAVLGELALLLVALVPQSIWASHGFPDGPIPRALAPVVAGAFYALPAVTGALTRRWQAAVVLATLPAWLDLGVFAVAAAFRVGPFYLAMDPQAVSAVGTLELFAALGALGWLTVSITLGARRHTQRSQL